MTNQRTKINYSPKTSVILAAVFFVIGLALIILGYSMDVRSEDLEKQCTETADAVIVEIRSSSKNGSNTKRTTYTPIVEYKVGSKTYTHKVTNPGKKNTFSVGEIIEIHYDPDDPKTAYVDREATGSSIFSVVMYICGAIIMVFGVVVIATIGKRRKQPSLDGMPQQPEQASEYGSELDRLNR